MNETTRENEDKVRLLFLCTGNSCRSQMAEGFARAAGGAKVEVYSAGVEARGVHPLTVAVMKEAGVDIGGQTSKTLDALPRQDFDLVVTLCDEAAGGCPVLPGNPVSVHWSLPDPAAARGGEAAQLEAFRKVRDEVRRSVGDLFDRGYLAALVHAKRNADLILDNLSEGVIAHDLQRRIFYFNAAAERITEYSRESVLNQDCHVVIPNGLCGAKCSFCDDTLPPDDRVSKEVEIVTRTGERRRIRMTIKYLENQAGARCGVLACFSDMTNELRLARRLGEVEHFAGIVGRDVKMLALFDVIPELAESNAPVLIQGESGTGKELIAAALHYEGPRADKLFVPVNCGALPEGLLESELFGHVKGAFTGAIRDKKGRFELADGGTIFLDEIGDISPAMQVKLLRVLQEGSFERVGSEKTLKVNVRVISATNKDIAKEMAEGRFREDLFYRLSVVPLPVPPLRERRNDIPALAEHFLKRIAAETGRSGLSFSSDALSFMMSYSWPGNVRELQNWIQFALIKCKDKTLRIEHLPPVALGTFGGPYAAARRDAGRLKASRGHQRLDDETVRRAIEEAGGNKVEASRLLGVSRATLYRFIESREKPAGEPSSS